MKRLLWVALLLIVCLGALSACLYQRARAARRAAFAARELELDQRMHNGVVSQDLGNLQLSYQGDGYMLGDPVALPEGTLRYQYFAAGLIEEAAAREPSRATLLRNSGRAVVLALPSPANAVLATTDARGSIGIEFGHGLESGGSMLSVHDAMQREPARPESTRAAENLARVITAFAQPQLEPKRDELRVFPNGIIVLQAPRSTQEWLQRFLETQLAARPSYVLEFQVLRAPKGSLFESAEGSGDPRALEPQAVDALLARAMGSGQVISAPKIAVEARARAAMEALTPIGYVKEWRLARVEPGNQEVVDPLIEAVNEGQTFDVIAAPVDEERVGVDLQFTNLEVAKPMASESLVLADAHSTRVEVGKPTQRKSELSTRFVVKLSPKGEKPSGVLFRVPSEDPNFELAILVRVTEFSTAPSTEGVLGENK